MKLRIITKEKKIIEFNIEPLIYFSSAEDFSMLVIEKALCTWTVEEAKAMEEAQKRPKS